MTRMPGRQMFMFGISFNFLWQIPASVSFWINIYPTEWISYTNTPCCFLLMNASLDRRTSCARGHATLLAVAPWLRLRLKEHLSLPHTTHPSVNSKAKIKTNLCGLVSLPHRHALMQQKSILVLFLKSRGNWKSLIININKYKFDAATMFWLTLSLFLLPFASFSSPILYPPFLKFLCQCKD